jgi:class 3 adenylate cyclase
VRCPTCGVQGGENARFCANCGTPLLTRTKGIQAGWTDRAVSPGRNPTGDRRIVTALFADLVDYVRMLAEHDPEDVRARVTSALATMATAIERLDGTR